MNIELPQPVETYFRAANSHDSALLADCFKEDAAVYDEGEVYRGLAAIKEWNEATGKKYEFTLEVISAAIKAGEAVVIAQASGNFEGSPASIEFYFTVENQKIASLRCG
jgi:hypothetical protein